MNQFLLLHSRTYFVSNADESIVKTKSQILTIIGPATACDATAHFVFSYRLLFW